MVKEFGHNQWALIIGGSSGLGLATARKLAKEGLNICIVHRNARSQMKEIEKSFDARGEISANQPTATRARWE